MNQDIRHAYNAAADAYRQRYDSIPPRVEDVDAAFARVSTSNPVVVEIGCAYGREARYILTKTSQYTGIDISEKYIKMAKAEIPTADFVCTDVADYEFPSGIDVVFAFASLLHASQEEVEEVLKRVAMALNSGGIIFLSLKRRAQYETAIETDDAVSRRFYYYSRQTILDIAPPHLTEVFYDEQSRKEEWFTMMLQKTSHPITAIVWNPSDWSFFFKI